jgi:ABC-type transporter Mla MlaB component
VFGLLVDSLTQSASVRNGIRSIQLRCGRSSSNSKGARFAGPISASFSPDNKTARTLMAGDNVGRGTDGLSLAGSVTLQVVRPLLTKLCRAAREHSRTCFQLNCSAVTAFTAPALAELVKMRREVREHGCDLVLVGVSRDVWDCLKDPLFKSLVEGGRPADLRTPALHGPHQPTASKWKPAKPVSRRREPYFLRLRGTRFQRFWLN